MRKTLLLLSAILLFASMHAQEIVYEHPIRIKASIQNRSHGYVVSSESMEETPVFLYDEKNLYSLTFNPDFTHSNLFLLPKSDIPFRAQLLEGVVDKKGLYHLLFSNSGETEFLIESIDPATQSSTYKMVPFKFGEEVLLGTYLHNDTVHLLSVQREPAALKVYTFAGNQYLGMKRLNEVPSPDGATQTVSAVHFLRDLHEKKYDRRSDKSFGIIGNEFPASLPIAAKKAKMYIQENTIILSLDDNPASTKLLTIDIQDRTFYIQEYPHNNMACQDLLKIKANSFIHDGMLYQLLTCPDELYASIYRLSSHTKTKEFHINKNEQPDFANTAIYIEDLDGKRPISKTKTALQKLSKLEIGIVALWNEGNLEITMGGYELIESSAGGGVMMTPGSSVSTPAGNFSMGPNLTYRPSSYSSRMRIIQVKALLDSTTLEKVNDGIFPHPYERMRKHRVKGSMITLQIFVRKGDDYYRGYFRRRDEKFVVKKFN